MGFLEPSDECTDAEFLGSVSNGETNAEATLGVSREEVGFKLANCLENGTEHIERGSLFTGSGDAVGLFMPDEGASVVTVISLT
jgi:hypothetical protein